MLSGFAGRLDRVDRKNGAADRKMKSFLPVKERL
jgi:hypothetical protein